MKIENNSFKFNRMFLSALLLCQGTMGFAQSSDETNEPELAESSIEEITVFGIRKSLESALQAKRNRTNLTELINAEDIGKLPDENVAKNSEYRVELDRHEQLRKLGWRHIRKKLDEMISQDSI